MGAVGLGFLKNEGSDWYASLFNDPRNLMDVNLTVNPLTACDEAQYRKCACPTPSCCARSDRCSPYLTSRQFPFQDWAKDLHGMATLGSALVVRPKMLPSLVTNWGMLVRIRTCFICSAPPPLAQASRCLLDPRCTRATARATAVGQPFSVARRTRKTRCVLCRLAVDEGTMVQILKVAPLNLSAANWTCQLRRPPMRLSARCVPGFDRNCDGFRQGNNGSNASPCRGSHQCRCDAALDRRHGPPIQTKLHRVHV